MKVPLLENTCILLLAVSATYTLPDDESTAIPAGDLKVPFSLPYFPNRDIKVPLLENTCILWLAVSATYTLPDDESTAMPSGLNNIASLLPVSLQLRLYENS
jgi:hypothetical protein